MAKLNEAQSRVLRDLQNIYVDAMLGKEDNVRYGLRGLRENLKDSKYAATCTALRLSGIIDHYAIIFQVLENFETPELIKHASNNY